MNDECQGCSGSLLPVPTNSYLVSWKNYMFCCIKCFDHWEAENGLDSLVKDIDNGAD